MKYSIMLAIFVILFSCQNESMKADEKDLYDIDGYWLIKEERSDIEELAFIEHGLTIVFSERNGIYKRKHVIKDGKIELNPTDDETKVSHIYPIKIKPDSLIIGNEVEKFTFVRISRLKGLRLKKKFYSKYEGRIQQEKIN